jgi:hypothetical protein
MRVTIAQKCQARCAILRDMGFEPDLARAAAHFIDFIMGGFGQGGEFAPEFNQIAVAVVPLL